MTRAVSRLRVDCADLNIRDDLVLQVHRRKMNDADKVIVVSVILLRRRTGVIVAGRSRFPRAHGCSISYGRCHSISSVTILSQTTGFRSFAEQS